MVLLEQSLLTTENIDNTKERKRKAKRRETAEKCGTTFVATLIERFTVRALKFIRWLRNFVYRPTSWEAALARLRDFLARSFPHRCVSGNGPHTS
jgi:hypothetical protein